MTTRAALELGQKKLNGITEPAGEAELLLAHTLKAPRSAILAHPERKLTAVEQLCYRWRLAKRAKGVPLAYITGTREFYGHTFKVSRFTLVPRPDTETLVETALKIIRQEKLATAYDIGTGSGCIGISLALDIPSLRVIATDVSQKALTVAKDNARLHKVRGRLTFVRGSLLKPLLHEADLQPNSLVVANLPYLSGSELSGELRHEPRGALVAGEQGLALYKELLTELKLIPSRRRPRHVLLEAHPPTAEQLLNMAKNILPDCQAELLRDMSGLNRVLRLSLA